MDSRVADLLGAQGGAGSARQLLDAGVPRDVVTTLVRSRELVRVRRDAVVLASALDGAPPWERLALAARAVGHSLASATGPRPDIHALSHESALMIQRLPFYGEDGLVHLSRTDGVRGRRGQGIFVHQPVNETWVRTVDGLRVVTPALAALQVAATHGIEAGLVSLDGVLHDAGLRDRAATGHPDGPASAEVRRQVERALEQGVVHARATVRQVVDLADGRSESAGESRSRWVLHLLGFGPFDVQHVVTTEPDAHGRTEFLGRADLKLRRWRVLVEFDGQDKYCSREDLFAEKRREDAIRAQGYVVVRLTWADLARPDLVRQKVLAAIALAEAAERRGA